MKRTSLFTLIGILALAALLLMPATGQAQRKRMTIGTASIGGVYYPVGTGIASIINKYVPMVDVRVEVTGGGIENPRLVGGGQTDLAISNDYIVSRALRGAKPYPKAYPDIRAIAQMYPSVLHLVTRKDFTDIQTLADLKGRRVAAGPAGGGSALFLSKMLTYVGLTMKDIKPSYISYKDGALALQDGNVDAAVMMAGMPTAALLELSIRTPIRHLRMGEQAFQKFLGDNPSLIRVVVPKSYYKTEQDGVTMGAGNVLLVNKSMSEEMAHKITAALWDHVEEFRKIHPTTKVVDLRTATKTKIPIHPGAARYYKEKRVLE